MAALFAIAITPCNHALAQRYDSPAAAASAVVLARQPSHPEPSQFEVAGSINSGPMLTSNLPDEPVPSRSVSTSESSVGQPSDSAFQPNPITRTLVAPTYHRYIEPDQIAQRLSPGRQFIFGLAQPISPYFLLTIAAAAGYEQAVEGAPNYGSNITAYGQRVGAAAARNASQSFFSYSVMAPLLHEDARYYVMGNRRSAFVRTTYAVSRAVITRDANDGHATVNYAEISGYAEAAGLTNAYYPPVNRTLDRTVDAFGVSIVGLALSNVVREFFPNILQATHLN